MVLIFRKGGGERCINSPLMLVTLHIHLMFSKVVFCSLLCEQLFIS